MRDLLSKMTAGALIAGGALALAACGGGEAANNMATMEMNATDTMMDGTTNDVTAIDAGTDINAAMPMDANMTMDANGTMDMNEM